MILEFPENYRQGLERFVSTIGYSLTKPQRLAEAVKRLSDYYIGEPEGATPWRETWAQAAYAAYFFPLNYVRTLGVIQRLQQVGFSFECHDLIDFGSGPATASLALKDVVETLAKSPVHCIELSHIPQKIVSSVSSKKFSFQESIQKSQVRPKTFFLASYSLTEVQNIFDVMTNCDRILLLEPATHQDGRKLMELKTPLQDAGFHTWAPCTHEKKCPLLTHSERDWCHDRFEWKQPDWISDIEKLLPFQHKTLTVSYLAMSREPKVEIKNLARITGDLQNFKGFSKQLICRGDEREFVSWQKKYFKLPQEFLRGDLVLVSEVMKKVSNELRPEKKDDITQSIM